MAGTTIVLTTNVSFLVAKGRQELCHRALAELGDRNVD